MKKILLLSILFALCLTVFQAKAQRYFPGQQGLQITGSVVDGYFFNDNKETAYSFDMALSRYTHSQGRYFLGVGYLEKQYPYKNITIPMAQFTLEGGYYKKFLSTPGKVMLFSIGASALGGYETSNWGEKKLFDGSTLENEDSFIYGGTVGFEIETYLTDRIVLLTFVKERILFGSEIGKFHTQIGCGVKFLLN